MLTRAQIDEYNEVGAIVLPGVLTQQEVARLRAVTDSFVAQARGMTGHDDVLDLDETHTPDAPRVRRIKRPHLRHPEYAAYWRHPGIIAALTDLWGPNIRSDTSKLNMKLAGHGAAVEWHQDWVFYPHTNDDLAEVGIMIDAATTGNGPMLVVPGTWEWRAGQAITTAGKPRPVVRHHFTWFGGGLSGGSPLRGPSWAGRGCPGGCWTSGSA